MKENVNLFQIFKKLKAKNYFCRGNFIQGNFLFQKNGPK